MRSFRSESHSTPSYLLCCAGALCFTLLAAAQNAAPPKAQAQKQPAPTLTITTREVLLDVVVTDAAGHPVTGLKVSDFTVLEDGKPQAIASLQEHAATSARLDVNPPLPPNTFTNYAPVANSNAYTVILLDALNTRLDDQMAVRVELIKYLRHMPPGPPIAIFERDTRMHLVQGFTSDPKALLAAAESERNNPALLKLVRGTREEYLVYRMDNVAAGFDMLGRYLAGFPGRKNLIWFTGALPQSDIPEPMSNPFNDDLRILQVNPNDMTAALTLSRVAVYPIDARSLQVAPQYTAASNRPPLQNANIQFDNEQGLQHTSLDLIAEATGGRAYYSSNGLGRKIAEIETNGSHYYTLTYATTNKDWNGEFRHIRIEANQPQVKLQYRQGYFALDRSKQEQADLAAMAGIAAEAGANESPGSEGGEQVSELAPATTANEPAASGPQNGGFNDAMLLGAVPSTEVIFTAHVSEDAKVEHVNEEDAWPQNNHLVEDYRYKPFHTYTVDFSVDPKTLPLIKGPDGAWHGNVVFVTVVYNSTAQNVNSMLTTKTLDLDDAQHQDFVEHGISERHEIAVPANGNYFLRLGIHDTVNDRIGALEIAADQVRPEPGGMTLQSK